MKTLAYDLHIHSCLSPCADDDMTPANIAGMAMVAGLDVIAVTDHNSCRNCRAAMKAGEQYGITVIPGMELCTREEVHVLCLFYDLADAERFSEEVRNSMLPVANRTDLFGNQLVFDELDQQIGVEELLLITASDIAFSEVSQKMAEYHGVMIPAHIDKQSNSLLYQLGMIPADASFGCFEVREMARLHELRGHHPYLNHCKPISNSDAHNLCNINGPVNSLYVDENRVECILNALHV